MKTQVITYYLEMNDPKDLRPKRVTRGDLEIRKVGVGSPRSAPSPEFSRFLYTAVGGEWYWLDRLGWTRDQWFAWLNREGRKETSNQ